MEFFKNFCKLTHAYNLIFTFASCFVMYSFAHYAAGFNSLNFIILVAVLCCIHLGANLYNDYIQVKHQLVSGKKLNEVSFGGFLPKAELILNKTFSIAAVRRIVNGLFVFALALAVSFSVAASSSMSFGWVVIPLFLLGIVLSVLNGVASKHYCAELITGFVFGPLMIAGGYYTLVGGIDPRLLILSFAVMFAVMTVSHVINIMNWEFDINSGKKTLALLTGSKQNAIRLLSVLCAIPYAIVLIGVLSNEFNKTMLFVFLTLPVATKLISSVKEYVQVKNVEFKPRWYWGIFENWKVIKECGVDFFMFRLYLARNYAVMFSIIAAIGVMK